MVEGRIRSVEILLFSGIKSPGWKDWGEGTLFFAATFQSGVFASQGSSFSCCYARSQYQVCSLGQLESLFISGVLILLLSPDPVFCFSFVILHFLILCGWVRGGVLKPEICCSYLF